MHQNGNAELSTAVVTILVSLPSSFSTKWVWLILNRTQNLKLDGRVYHGISKSPFPQINNMEYEARNEIYSGKAVFASITKKENGEIDGDWIIKYLPQLVNRGIEINLGLVGIDVADLANVHKMSTSADINIFPTPEKWLDYLFEELNKYSKGEF